MKNIIYLLLIFPILLACGDDKEESVKKEMKNEKITKDFLIGTWIVDDGQRYDNVVVFLKNGDVLVSNYNDYMLYGNAEADRNSQWDLDEIKQNIIITSRGDKEWLEARYVNSNQFEVKEKRDIVTLYREGHYDRMKYSNDKSEDYYDESEDYYEGSEDYYDESEDYYGEYEDYYEDASSDAY